MYEGRIADRSTRTTADVHEIGLLMTGARRPTTPSTAAAETDAGRPDPSDHPPRAAAEVAALACRWRRSSALRRGARHQRRRHCLRRRRPDRVLRPHPERVLRRRRRAVGHAGQGDAAASSPASPARSRSGCGCGTSAPRASCCSGRGARAPSSSLPILPAGTPAFVRDPGDDAGRRRGGRAVGPDPGPAQGALGVNEIITTLMLNYIALSWIQFWVFGPWSEGGFQQSEPFPPRGLAAAADRLRLGSARLRRPDGPSRLPVRARRRR